MNSSLLLSWVTFGYFFSALFYLISLVLKKQGIGQVAGWIIRIFFLTQTGAIILRWVESYQMEIGHAPLSNLYESLIFFSWTIALIYIWIEWKTKSRAIGVFATPFAFLAMAYASFSPNMNTRIQPLLPALQSNWLIAHVITCFLGYAAFAVSCSLSIMYLIKKPRTGKKKDNQGLLSFFPGIPVLDELVYQTIIIGFLLLTVGIATGAIWAHSAWGTYWSWDPKETWSLITWLLYAALLHARMVKGWYGTRIAWLSIIGFACVLFTYFGVNFLLSGLHSYGAT
ncbi:MAG: c-type cytochrome biogenesis protein CcsB [Deltaproteobacteria bacterium RBG_13_43_22]|nr:MAG: c-type cytochrome biogenesis protein CcsB [Deltaproteobacteria bacterium RBG_13_43_22]